VPGAQVICDLMTPEGERFPATLVACWRGHAEAAPLGFDYSVAMELEFFPAEHDTATGGVRPGRHDRASYFDHPVDVGSGRSAEIVGALDRPGYHRRGQPSRGSRRASIELDLALSNALKSADQL